MLFVPLVILTSSLEDLGTPDSTAPAVSSISAIALLIGTAFSVAGLFIATPSKVRPAARLVQLESLRTLITAHVVIAFSVMTFIASIGRDNAATGDAVGVLLVWIAPGLIWTWVTVEINRLRVAQQEHSLDTNPNFPR